MRFSLKPMEEREAVEISEWHYNPPYTFYDFASDLEDAKEFLDFKNWPDDKYFSVLDKSGELVGFFEMNHHSGYIEIGLGMRPDMTGNGLGLTFVETGIDFIVEKFKAGTIKLKVASFNERAIKVYERAGFKASGRVWIKNDLGSNEFVEMELKT